MNDKNILGLDRPSSPSSLRSFTSTKKGASGRKVNQDARQYTNHPSGFPKAEYTIDTSKHYELCAVGAGLSGTVFAERTATLQNQKVLVIDSRNHIGGNCFDYVDQRVGIIRNKYGSHLFHTNIQRVWDYVNQFTNAPPFKTWYHQKVGLVSGKYVPIPANIITVNTLFDLNIQTKKDMIEWLKTVQIPCPETGCENGEQMAKSRVGEELYKAIFETYTIKQWGKSPRDMNASVTARIPVRDNFDPRYFADKWQALPENGYTEWFRAVLDHENIDVVLSTDFFDHKQHLESHCEKIVYTGPIDRYFESVGYDKLEYRSIDFHEKIYYNHSGYVLPTPVVNYPGNETLFTRSVEYKQYLHRPSLHSIVVSETTTDQGDPYYPVPTRRNLELYQKYKDLADELEADGNILFVGRLANYKYFNMDQAIDNALGLFYKSFWTSLFVGEEFKKYKTSIESKMKERVASRKNITSECRVPSFFGEFGMEFRCVVPWAYALSQDCRIATKGAQGSKYMYFFSDDHTIVNEIRKPIHLPDGNPFKSTKVHMKDFPYDTKWMAPPFKDFFRRREVEQKLVRKPLLFISNKYTMEWQKKPANFISKTTLRQILLKLVDRYTIVYKRHTSANLRDEDGKEFDLEEKAMIREEFPSIVLYEDLSGGLEVEDQNLLLFSLLASSKHHISVQGGTAVVSSYFGGTNIILIKKGHELWYGDYGYFHRFSNATVLWEKSDRKFLDTIERNL